MKAFSSDFKMIQGLCFRLLPIQVLLAMVGSVNGIVSSLFASNFVGTDAMSAIGLYSPINSFFLALNTMMMGGSQIICGKYMGRHEISGMQNVFSVNILVSLVVSVAASLVFFAAGILDLTGMFTSDAVVRGYFNRYLIGMSVGIVPQVIGQQLSGFLSLENKNKLTTVAGIVYILINLALDYLFVAVLRMEAFGLALATSLGLWVFAGVQVLYYIRGKSVLRLQFRKIQWKEFTEIFRIGAPGALSYGYQALRGLIVNMLTLSFVGSVGISAFTASNSFLCLFWAIPGGMLAVSIDGYPCEILYLPDDPADSRGCLSHHYQPVDNLLEEAGTYGTLCDIRIPSDLLLKLKEKDSFTLTLNMRNGAGLSLYSRTSGRYGIGIVLKAE